MKKYIAPAIEIHTLVTENMLALSTTEKSADSRYNVLSNQRDENVPTDFWGNEL